MDNHFRTIVADPPWRFGNTSSRAAAENHYPTMSVTEIVGLRHKLDIWPENGHLYLWTTAAHLREALQVMMEWDFEYKLNLVWVKSKAPPKLQIGLGNYFRHAHELCLFGVRGKCQAKVHNLPTVFFAPRSKHSKKPDEFSALVEKLSPGPYLELFARRRRENWSSWGNDPNLTVAAPGTHLLLST